MCDYSLAEYKTRLAVEGETLVTHRFSTGTVGLVSRGELQAAMTYCTRICAVCVPHGTKVDVNGCPGTLIQATMEVNRHRDAIQFDSGGIMSLQNMSIGVAVKIMSPVEVAEPVVAKEPVVAPANEPEPVPVAVNVPLASGWGQI